MKVLDVQRNMIKNVQVGLPVREEHDALEDAADCRRICRRMAGIRRSWHYTNVTQNSTLVQDLYMPLFQVSANSASWTSSWIPIGEPRSRGQILQITFSGITLQTSNGIGPSPMDTLLFRRLTYVYYLLLFLRLFTKTRCFSELVEIFLSEFL